MEKVLNFLGNRWVYHSLIWLIFLLLLNVTYEALMTEVTKNPALNITFLKAYTFVSTIVIVYGHFYIKDYFIKRKKYLIYALSVVLFVIVIYFLEIIIIDALFENYKAFIGRSYIDIILLIVSSTVLQFFKRLIEKLIRDEKNKANTNEIELNSLKAQINPHFLFNNLNNIYAMNQIDSEKGSEMILELADLLRYHLQLSEKKFISLKDEIQIINSYILLEKLRLNENCKLNIDISPPDKPLSMAPLLLIPFIENAFKHGTHPVKDCYIYIKLYTIDKELFLIVKNSIVFNKKIVKTNIGLQNTRKRLNILYPNKHSLAINQDQNNYKVSLSIKL